MKERLATLRAWWTLTPRRRMAAGAARGGLAGFVLILTFGLVLGLIAAVSERGLHDVREAVLITVLTAIFGGAPIGAGIGLAVGAARTGPEMRLGPAGARRLLPIDALIAGAQALGPSAFIAVIFFGPFDGWRHAAQWVSSASMVDLGPTQARMAIGGTLWLALAIALLALRANRPLLAGPLRPLDRWSLAGSGFAAGLFGLPTLFALALS